MLVLLSLLISTPGFTASNFENAMIGSTQSYRADFQSENGKVAPEPYGYFLENEGDETLSTVFHEDWIHQESNKYLAASVYGCHEHKPGEFDCHKEDKKNLGDYSRSTNLYNADEMKKSLPLALEFFVRNVAPESTISSVKLWEAFSNIRYVVQYKKDNSIQSYFLACHYHSGEMDCHRKRDAGPGEPKAGE
jgi:hypothetical protein